jgi:squalene-hopene/tetraprenyl-beta-curcumene cyclase
MGSTANIKESNIERAIQAGVDYILSLQSEDGSWSEWELPLGSSAPWATGYIGYSLRCLPLTVKPEIKSRLFQAAHWLLQNIFDDDGWGYSSTVGSDADSTAYVILFLNSIGQRVPEAALTELAQYQSSDGGFATYRPTSRHDSWTCSHPDVTPVALLALLRQHRLTQNALRSGIDYILKERTSDLWWNTFWWNSRIYATAANLSFMNAINISPARPKCIEQFAPENVFESALLIFSLLYLNPTLFRSIIKTQVNTLISSQRPDGSWNNAPILRITRRDCFTPWTTDNAGPLFSDTNRLFATATAVEALSKSFQIPLIFRQTS